MVTPNSLSGILLLAGSFILAALVVVLLYARYKLKTARDILYKQNTELERLLQEGVTELRSEIMERQDAERALRESEMRFRSAFELPSVGFALTAPNKGWIQVSSGLCKMLGYAEQELKQLTWAELTHPDDLDLDVTQFQRVLAGEINCYALDKRFVHKNGQIIWIHLSVDCVRRTDGAVNYFIALIQDITERKRIEQAEREQRALAEALRDTAQALNSRLGFDEVLDEILKNIRRVLPIDSANIALLEANGTLRYTHFYGYEQYQMPEQSADAPSFSIHNSPLYWHVFETGDPLIVSDTHNQPEWIVVPASAWIRSWAVMPIRNQNQVIGFLNLDSTTVNRYTPAHLETLRAFADQAAIAIDNARLYQETLRRAEQMDRVNQIGLAVNAGLNLNQVARTLYEQCCAVVPLHSFYIALYNAAQHLIYFPLLIDHGVEIQVAPTDIRTRPGLTGYVIQTAQTVYIPDLYDPAAPLAAQRVTVGEPDHTYVGVPLILRDQTIGVLSVQAAEINAYQPDQIRFLETIATQAAVAIENARLYAQVQQSAITDALTGVFNRRGLYDLGEREIERARRFQRDFGIIILDLDHFKLINDKYGHPFGDRVLRDLVECCRTQVRSIDILARYGGEEFVLLLPEADRIATLQVAERIREAVAQMVLTESDAPSNEPAPHLTVSLGVAMLGPDAHTLSALIARADRALYLAKQGGRNRVVADD